jgi:hypothetical protein
MGKQLDEKKSWLGNTRSFPINFSKNDGKFLENQFEISHRGGK